MRKAALTGLGVALCLALSGCLQFQKLKWDPIAVKPGHKITGVVSLISNTDPSVRDKMVPFVLFGFDTNGAALTLQGTPQFDPSGGFGGPKPMFIDATLRNVAIQSQDCAFGGSTLDQVQDTDWVAVRTQNKVHDKNETEKAAKIEAAVKVPDGSGSGQVPVYVFAGNWGEGANPNGQIEDGEVVCSGGTISNFTVK